MLATLTREPFDNGDWLFEVKWDGYRIISHIEKGKVTLRSRSLLNYTNNYPSIANAITQLKHDAVIDGELVVLDKNGNPSFDQLQAYDPHKDQIVYYVFDLLWLDGESLIDTIIEKRKEKLFLLCEALNSELIKYSADFPGGKALFEQTKKMGMEGIVAKKKGSLYTPGKRSKEWLKIPAHIRQEFVIGGWTESDNARLFRSLLFGYYEKGKLYYQGHAGGGFRERDMPHLLSKLKKLETKKKPFVNEVDIDRKIHWVKPELVADMRYATTTRSGKIRKPTIFVGLRPDKKASEVGVTPTSEKPISQKENKRRPKKFLSESHWPDIENEVVTSKGEVEIGGHQVQLTNIEKELWKGITKADLINYYHVVADYILPYLHNRPLSLHIKQAGPTKTGFYIKDMEGMGPAFADMFITERKHKKEGKRNVIEYIVCNNEATLLYLINLGCIDLNPWSSTKGKPFTPDYISIDLDPSDDDFAKAIVAALATKQLMDENAISALVKTSGKTGMHIYIPCHEFDFAMAREIAENICNEVHRLVPAITTTNISINQRGNKLFIDPSQNDFADTLAAPYSVRSHYLPTVSTPLSWKEVKPTLTPHAFTIQTIHERIKKKGDLFKDLLLTRQSVKNTRGLKKFL